MNDMSEEKEGGLFTCPVMSWIVGALLGFATYLSCPVDMNMASLHPSSQL